MKDIQNNNTHLRIVILLLIQSYLLYGCNKEPNNVFEPEVINYDNLDGKIAFSRMSGKIIILDGEKQTSTTLSTIDEASIWEASVSLSPDGENITYSANADDGYQVFKMSVRGENNLKLTKSLSGFVEHYMCPVWDSDGGNIYYVENGQILLGPVYSMKSDGTDRKQITDFSVYRRVAISKDKNSIVYSNASALGAYQNSICIYMIEDDSVRQIVTYEADYTAYSPVLSPDEKKIAYVVRHGPNEQGTTPYYFRIKIISIDGTDDKSVIELPFIRYVTDTYVTWSPDGTKLSFNYGSGTSSDQGSHIFIINSDGTGLTQITSNTDYDGAPSWID